MLIRIAIAALLLGAVKLLKIGGWAGIALYAASYITIGYDILRKAFRGIINHQVFDENFLMAVATVGAIALAIYEKTGDFAEAVSVMLFYQIGELFQSYAVGKSRRNIAALMDIRPDYANIERDGRLEQVDPDQIPAGSVIVVQPGEKVPIDGQVMEGASSLDTAALTGESRPRDVKAGDDIISGCINLTGVLKVRTTKAFGESTVSKILELMENSSSHEIPLRELHIQVRPGVYPCRMLQRIGPRHTAPRYKPHDGHAGRLGNMGIPGIDLPGNQLPLRAGDKHPLSSSPDWAVPARRGC
mgnify:CR=1 FL=1